MTTLSELAPHTSLDGAFVGPQTASELQLRGVDFSWCHLQNVTFLRCEILGCSFHGATLEGCTFHSCDLFELDLSNADLQRCTLLDCDLTSLLTEGTTFQDCQATECRLQNLDTQALEEQGLSLHHCTAQSTSSDANHEGHQRTDLVGARLRPARANKDSEGTAVSTDTLWRPKREFLCAHCHETLPAGQRGDCTHCHSTPLLRGRYCLLRPLGSGSFGSTFEAIDATTRDSVAIKELSIRKLNSIKTLELFEREASVLQGIHHHGVPTYIEHFDEAQGKDLSLYLVQEFVDGQSLRQEINALTTQGFSPIDCVDILVELLQILDHLHNLHPPVVHRDIKPSNIMRRADGSLVLIDFGAVRELAKATEHGGSTVAGTFGYMAPEQFAGTATPATDIYALGVVAVELLSRHDPQSLLDERNTLQWEPVLPQIPKDLLKLLRSMLHVDHKARASNAAELSQRLRACSLDPSASSRIAPSTTSLIPSTTDVSTQKPDPPPNYPLRLLFVIVFLLISAISALMFSTMV